MAAITDSPLPGNNFIPQMPPMVPANFTPPVMTAASHQMAGIPLPFSFFPMMGLSPFAGGAPSPAVQVENATGPAQIAAEAVSPPTSAGGGFSQGGPRSIAGEAYDMTFAGGAPRFRTGPGGTINDRLKDEMVEARRRASRGGAVDLEGSDINSKRAYFKNAQKLIGKKVGGKKFTYEDFLKGFRKRFGEDFDPVLHGKNPVTPSRTQVSTGPDLSPEEIDRIAADIEHNIRRRSFSSPEEADRLRELKSFAETGRPSSARQRELKQERADLRAEIEDDLDEKERRKKKKK